MSSHGKWTIDDKNSASEKCKLLKNIEQKCIYFVIPDLIQMPMDDWISKQQHRNEQIMKIFKTKAVEILFDYCGTTIQVKKGEVLGLFYHSSFEEYQVGDYGRVGCVPRDCYRELGKSMYVEVPDLADLNSTSL